MRAGVGSLALPRVGLTRPALQEAALIAFFLALAVSISASQILLTLLLLFALPCGALARTRGAPGALLAVARETWTDAAPLRRHPLTRPFLVLVGLTLLSALTSGDPGWSLWLARDTLRIATFYLVLWYTRDSAHALRLWKGFLVVLTLMACYGIAQAYLCASYAPAFPPALRAEVCAHPERVSGPFSIYMTFGGVLLLGALFFLAYLANVSWRRVWWMVPAGTVTVVALALTYSRNAWLGLAAGALGLVATARQTFRVLLVLLAAALLVAFVSPDPIMDRIRSITDLRDESVRDRLAMWRSGLDMIADHPFLGVGPGQVRAWYPHYRRPEAVRPSTGHLHNSPVHLAAERGVPFLAAWVWLWVVFFREGGGILRRLGADRQRQRALICASLGGVAGFLVAGLFEHNFGDAEVVMLVYALMALPFVVAREATAPEPGPNHAGVVPRHP